MSRPSFTSHVVSCSSVETAKEEQRLTEIETLACNVSIIISTWNNAAQLRVTLTAISKCEIPKGLAWQVVIANNNCTDATDEVVSEFVGLLPLFYVHEPEPGASRGRNAALCAACGELIIVADDDFRPSSTWLSSYWEAFCRRPSGFFFGGSIRSVFEDAAISRELVELGPPSIRGLDLGHAARELSDNESFVMNFACASAELRAVGGFDVARGLRSDSSEVRVGEESELMDRLKEKGLKPWVVPGALVDHFVPARKVSAEHIFSRWEATAFDVTSRLLSARELRMPRCLLLKVKETMKVLIFSVLWRASKVVGGYGYRYYGRVQWSKGVLRSLNETCR